MKLPVLHNLDAIKGEVISLNIGYNNLVDETNLFACKVKFSINVSTDALKDDEACKITLSLDTNMLEAGKYQWDLFLWNGDRPIKCLVKGQVNVIEGISNRGK